MDDKTREALKAKGYTDAQIKENEEFLVKLSRGVVATAATGVALAGASVISVFKGNAKPLRSTFEWCKSNLFS